MVLKTHSDILLSAMLLIAIVWKVKYGRGFFAVCGQTKGFSQFDLFANGSGLWFF